MFEQTFKNIDDILHKDAGRTSELDCTEQSSGLLFLKYLDALPTRKVWFYRLNPGRNGGPSSTKPSPAPCSATSSSRRTSQRAIR